ncbi:MAG: hypothetical protein HOP08_02570 [Cyclobacteriaceae bacterium]|nr:hypothetical protein [Cyclobacteriaceae bacterium]
MRFIVVIFFILIQTHIINAQKFPSDLWHEGKLVLEDGDTLKGNVKYDLEKDLIQLDVNNKLESMTARKVVFFEIFDKTIKAYRQFYSLPFAASGGYKAPVFFELLSEGKLTLLSRESIEYRNYPNTFYSYGSSSRLVLVNHYFILKENGNIEPFSGTKNDVLDLMGNKSEQVAKYMKVNKLKVDNKYQFAMTVAYFNSLYK